MQFAVAGPEVAAADTLAALVENLAPTATVVALVAVDSSTQVVILH